MSLLPRSIKKLVEDTKEPRMANNKSSDKAPKNHLKTIPVQVQTGKDIYLKGLLKEVVFSSCQKDNRNGM